MLPLHGEAELAGLPDFSRGAARRRPGTRPDGTCHYARARASNPSCNSPTAAICASRSFRAWIERGDDGGATDNSAIVPRRCGCGPSARACSAFRLTPITSSTTRWRRRREAVREPARRSMGPAPASARAERDALQALVAARPAAILSSRRGTGAITPRSCARRDMISTKPRSSPISTSTTSSRRRSTPRERLFGLSFRRAPRHSGLASRCPHLRGARRDGRHVALFFGDYFARPRNAAAPG